MKKIANKLNKLLILTNCSGIKFSYNNDKSIRLLQMEIKKQLSLGLAEW